MEFTPITAKDFPDHWKDRHQLKPPSEFYKAVEKLKVGTGFSIPCKWKHNKLSNVCGGHSAAHYNARKLNYFLKCTCSDGIFYALRVEHGGRKRIEL